MFLNNALYGICYSVDHPPSLIQPADLALLRSQDTLQVGQMLAQVNQSAEQFYELGVESHRAGQVFAAIEAYQKAIQLNPTTESGKGLTHKFS